MLHLLQVVFLIVPLFIISLYCMVCYICLQVVLPIMPLFTVSLYCMVCYICLQVVLSIRPYVSLGILHGVSCGKNNSIHLSQQEHPKPHNPVIENIHSVMLLYSWFFVRAFLIVLIIKHDCLS